MNKSAKRVLIGLMLVCAGSCAAILGRTNHIDLLLIGGVGAAVFGMVMFFVGLADPDA